MTIITGYSNNRLIIVSSEIVAFDILNSISISI